MPPQSSNGISKRLEKIKKIFEPQSAQRTRRGRHYYYTQLNFLLFFSLLSVSSVVRNWFLLFTVVIGRLTAFNPIL